MSLSGTQGCSTCAWGTICHDLLTSADTVRQDVPALKIIDATDALPISIGHGGAVRGRLRRPGSDSTTPMSAEAQPLYDPIDEVCIKFTFSIEATFNHCFSQGLPGRLARSTCFNGSHLPRRWSGKPARCVMTWTRHFRLGFMVACTG